jgi:hypothetical protein
MTRKLPTTFALLLLLTSLGCTESDLGPDVESDVELAELETLELEAAAQPGGPAPASEATAKEPCAAELALDEGFDVFADMTAEELLEAPAGHLMMAPLQATDEAGCNAESIVSVQVAPGVPPDASIASLCADELPGGEVMLRECAEHEAALADLGMTSVTIDQEPVGGCYFCTGDTCLNNGSFKQRKEGSTGPCFPNFWDTCCWAFNGGCCS